MLHGRSFENIFFLLMLAIVTMAFLWVLSGYLTPMFWAIVLAVLFYPIHCRIHAGVGARPSLAASLTLLLILATVIVPTGVLALAVANESSLLVARMQSGEIDPTAIIKWVEGFAPPLVELLADLGIELEELRDRLESAAVSASQTIGTVAVAAGQGAVSFSIGFAVALYVLYFALRDGETIQEVVIRALPMGDDREQALMDKFAEVARATIKSTVVIGAIQGLLGGTIFAVLGIQGAIFWGVVMAVLSLLPAVGASLVWAPAAVFLMIDDRMGAALVLIGFGIGVISLVDNLLRPILVGRDTRIPDWLILVSTLGGLTAFGLSGFVIGPVIAALFLTFWTLFEREHHADFQPGGPAWDDVTAAGREALPAAAAASSAAPDEAPAEAREDSNARDAEANADADADAEAVRKPEED